MRYESIVVSSAVVLIISIGGLREKRSFGITSQQR